MTVIRRDFVSTVYQQAYPLRTNFGPASIVFNGKYRLKVSNGFTSQVIFLTWHCVSNVFVASPHATARMHPRDPTHNHPIQSILGFAHGPKSCSNASTTVTQMNRNPLQHVSTEMHWAKACQYCRRLTTTQTAK